MANPIKTSDILRDDNLDALIAKIKQLEAVIEGLTAAMKKQESEAVELEASTKKLNGTTASGRDEIVKNAKQAEQLEKTYTKLKEAKENQNAALIEMREQLKQANRLRQLEAKLNTSTKDSYDNLSAQLSILKIRYKQLTLEEQKNTVEGQKLTKRIKEIDETLKVMDANVGVHTRNVGNYRDAIAELPGVFGSAGRGAQGLSAQFKALLANPVVLIIGLISAGLVTLFRAFQRSEKGARLMAQASAALEGVMSVLVGVVDAIIEGIKAFTDDPVKGLKDLGRAIVTNLSNRLEGVLMTVGNLGKALGKLITGDFAGAKEAMKDVGIAAIQAATGLDEVQQSQVAETLREITNEAAATTKAFLNLEAARYRLAQSNRELTKSAEQLRTVEELNRAIADDATKSFAEREKAAEESRKALEARAAKEVQIAKNNLSLANAEIDLRRRNGENVQALLDNQLQAYQALAQAEREYTLAIRDNEKQRSELKQDRLERDLDILIDGFDNQKTVNERLLKDERLTLDERVKIYLDTQRLANDSLRKQIETIQEFTGVQVDANDLIATSDAVLLNQKIRSLGLSEIIEGRLLEIIRERRIVVQDLAEAEKDLIKEREKANKAQAVDLFDFGKKSKEGVLKRVREISDAAAKAARESLKEEQQPENIYDLLGITIGDEGKQQVQDAFSFAKQQLTDFLNFRTQIANRNVANADREVAAAENALNREIELQAAGLANNAAARQKDLADAQQKQREAIRAQEQAQRAQQRIQTIEQAVNLITAVSKVFSTVPFPLNIGAVAVMLGAFASAKIQAAQLSRREFAEGDFTILEGGSHASGNDIFVGQGKDGRPEYAEGGEARMILSRKSTRKYRSLLPEIFHSLKAGTFENEFTRQANAARELPLIVNTGGGQLVNMVGVEKGIGRLIAQGSERRYTDSKGRLVVQRGNLTTTYVN